MPERLENRTCISSVLRTERVERRRLHLQITGALPRSHKAPGAEGDPEKLKKMVRRIVVSDAIRKLLATGVQKANAVERP